MYKSCKYIALAMELLSAFGWLVTLSFKSWQFITETIIQFITCLIIQVRSPLIHFTTAYRELTESKNITTLQMLAVHCRYICTWRLVKKQNKTKATTTKNKMNETPSQEGVLRYISDNEIHV